MENPLFTIIIPVYNLENYIVECLESISMQTFTNYEVLIINDGSTDASQAKIEQYIRGKEKFRLFSKKNEGVSIARNMGIEYANGRYIWFVDGDDKILKEALSELAALLAKFDALDVIGFNYDFFGEHDFGDIPDKKELLLPVDGREFFKHYHLLIAASFVYNRDFLLENRIVFQKHIRVSEDNLFNIEVFNAARRMIQTNRRLYFYRQNRMGSATHGENYVGYFPSYALIFQRLNQLLPNVLTVQDIEKAKMRFWNAMNYYFRVSRFPSGHERMTTSALLYESAGPIQLAGPLTWGEKYDLKIYNLFRTKGFDMLQKFFFRNLRRVIVKLELEIKKNRSSK